MQNILPGWIRWHRGLGERWREIDKEINDKINAESLKVEEPCQQALIVYNKKNAKITVGYKSKNYKVTHTLTNPHTARKKEGKRCYIKMPMFKLQENYVPVLNQQSQQNKYTLL